jgi:hypothetical protein
MFNINIKLKNLAQAALVTVCGLSTLALSSNTPAHAQTITGYTDINDQRENIDLLYRLSSLPPIPS